MGAAIRHKHVHEASSSIIALVERLRDEDDERFLYRGQSGLFGPDGDYTRQIPSVFRQCRSASEADVALRHCHLQVAWLFDSVRNRAKPPEDVLDLDYAALDLGDLSRPQSPIALLGLAQHYGVPTEKLDLTFLDPAAVFATQSWMPIRKARSLPPGACAPVSSEFGVIYRYDTRRLLEAGIAVGDISSGNAGSRPILQEGRLITVQYDQDLELLEAGAYEVFPFRQSHAYTYSRPIKPSPLLSQEQMAVVMSASTYHPDPSMVGRSTAIGMRDFVVPSFHFTQSPFDPDSLEVSLGAAPDPYLGLGRLCEEVLPKTGEFHPHEDYARLLFGDFFGRSLAAHPQSVKFVRWLQEKLRREQGDKASRESTPAAARKSRAGSPGGTEESATKEPQLSALDQFRDMGNAPLMVVIPPGSFRMGSDEAIEPMFIDETPAKTCRVDASFAVGVYPVTMEEMAAFARDSEALSHAHIDFLALEADRNPRLPAVMSSWHDANAYCAWLSRKTGERYRLLTEMEWEYVCRAGTETRYWWGDEFDGGRANTRRPDLGLERIRAMSPPRTFDDATADLHYIVPVDSFGPNPWGLFDLHGNTWEWVQDVYSDDRTRPQTLLPSPAVTDKRYRSQRGGSWMDPPSMLRSAVRSWSGPSARDRNMSFRVARQI